MQIIPLEKRVMNEFGDLATVFPELEEGQIQRVSYWEYIVGAAMFVSPADGQLKHNRYRVNMYPGSEYCSCPVGKTGRECKHTIAVRETRIKADK